MKLRRTLLSIFLTAALGLGVWTLAVSFTSASFSDGDILTAADLNDLLNANFGAAATAINGLEGDVSSLETDVSALQSGMDNKLDRAGGNVSGRVNISGAAVSTGTGDTSTVFRVSNSASTGSAAVFNSNSSSNSGTVSIKQQGSGPVLSLKSAGGGAPFITGAGVGTVSFIVEANGSIKIGDMGPNGTGDPALHLDAANGTVTNSVGSGLPLAFGYVSAAGDKISGTDNFTVTRDGNNYRISFTGESYDRDGFASIVQGNSPGRYRTYSTDNGGDLLVTIYNSSGDVTGGAFHFVTFKDGN